jgi:hypothetical protein
MPKPITPERLAYVRAAVKDNYKRKSETILKRMAKQYQYKIECKRMRSILIDLLD